MKKLLDGALLAGLALCLVYATVAFGAVSTEYAAPLYALASALAILWAVKLLLSKEAVWVRSPMHWAVAAFALYATARYLTSPIEYDSRIELFHVGLYTLIYFLVASNFWRQRDRSIVVVVLMVLAVAEAAYGLSQFGSGGADTVLNADRPEQYHGRASGTYICPNHFAGFLEIVLGLLLARIAIHRSAASSATRRVVGKTLEIAVGLVVVAGIVTSLSRGGWVAAIAGFVFFVLWAWRARAIQPRVAAGVLAVLVLLVGSALAVPSVRERLAQTVVIGASNKTVDVKDATLAGRTPMWEATLKMIPDHPIFGTGPLTWEWFHLKYRDPRLQARPKYTHEDVLQLISDYGLVGLALVIAMLGCFFWHAMRMSGRAHSPGQRAFAVGSAVAVATIVVHSFVDFNMHIPANALLVVTLMGLTVAMDGGSAGGRRLEMKRAPRIALAASIVVLVAVSLRFGIPTVQASRADTWGNAYKEVLDWDQALDSYQRAIAADPKFPEPYAKIGDVYRSRSALAGATTEEHASKRELAQHAIAAYEQSLRLNEYQSEVMLRLASAFELAGDDSSALRTYKRALAVDPNNAFNYLRLAIFYRRLGAEQLAVEAFARSSQLGESDQISVINIEDIRRSVQPR